MSDSPRDRPLDIRWCAPILANFLLSSLYRPVADSRKSRSRLVAIVERLVQRVYILDFEKANFYRGLRSRNHRITF